MKVINVPLILQEKGSIDCGPTCTRMIMEYYGVKKTLKDIRSKLTYRKTGTTIYDNGSLLIDEGFNTTVVTAQPLLFPGDIIPTIKNKHNLLKLITEKLKGAKKDKWIIKTMIKYLKKNGNIKLEIPSFSHIKHAIDNDTPVLTLMYGQSMGRNEGKYHFVVVCGYKDKEIFINNPWPKSKRQGWFPFEQFIYGVHASTCVSVDNGTFLIPQKSA